MPSAAPRSSMKHTDMMCETFIMPSYIMLRTSEKLSSEIIRTRTVSCRASDVTRPVATRSRTGHKSAAARGPWPRGPQPEASQL